MDDPPDRRPAPRGSPGVRRPTRPGAVRLRPPARLAARRGGGALILAIAPLNCARSPPPGRGPRRPRSPPRAGGGGAPVPPWLHGPPAPAMRAPRAERRPRPSRGAPPPSRPLPPRGSWDTAPRALARPNTPSPLPYPSAGDPGAGEALEGGPPRARRPGARTGECLRTARCRAAAPGGRSRTRAGKCPSGNPRGPRPRGRSRDRTRRPPRTGAGVGSGGRDGASHRSRPRGPGRVPLPRFAFRVS